MVTELIVIRHGETEWNKIGRQQGQSDSPLSENGVRQAETIRDLRERYDVIISSDLGRAMQTARIIAETSAIPVIPEAGLRERHLGILQGLTMQDLKEKHPDVFDKFSSSDPNYVIPEGESAAQRYARAIETFDKIVATHGGQKLLVVTHGGIVQSLFLHTLTIPLGQKRTFSLINAALNRFIHAEGWKLLSWGETSHLKGLQALDDF